MANIFSKTVQMSLGLALVVFVAQAAEAGTKPCPSCGAGTRPSTGPGGGANIRPTAVFRLPNGSTFTLPGRPASTSAASTSAARATGGPVLGASVVTSRTRVTRPPQQ